MLKRLAKHPAETSRSRKRRSSHCLNLQWSSLTPASLTAKIILLNMFSIGLLVWPSFEQLQSPVEDFKKALTFADVSALLFSIIIAPVGFSRCSKSFFNFFKHCLNNQKVFFFVNNYYRVHTWTFYSYRELSIFFYNILF